MNKYEYKSSNIPNIESWLGGCTGGRESAAICGGIIPSDYRQWLSVRAHQFPIKVFTRPASSTDLFQMLKSWFGHRFKEDYNLNLKVRPGVRWWMRGQLGLHYVWWCFCCWWWRWWWCVERWNWCGWRAHVVRVQARWNLTSPYIPVHLWHDGDDDDGFQANFHQVGISSSCHPQKYSSASSHSYINLAEI